MKLTAQVARSGLRSAISAEDAEAGLDRAPLAWNWGAHVRKRSGWCPGQIDQSMNQRHRNVRIGIDVPHHRPEIVGLLLLGRARWGAGNGLCGHTRLRYPDRRG